MPHLFSTTIVYELPFGRGRRWVTDGLASKILGNWQLNTIVQARTGQPYTLFMNVDVANIGAINQAVRARPNLVGVATLDSPTPEVWFNRSACEATEEFRRDERNLATARGTRQPGPPPTLLPSVDHRDPSIPAPSLPFYRRWCARLGPGLTFGRSSCVKGSVIISSMTPAQGGGSA